MIEKAALEKAEEECLADSEIREGRRDREAEKRPALDQEYVESFAVRIRMKFPRCPEKRERMIAEHSCLKYSGRVGRSAAAKKLDEGAVHLAVIAHIRHSETDYDLLLARGYERSEARSQVQRQIDRILDKWQ